MNVDYTHLFEVARLIGAGAIAGAVATFLLNRLGEKQKSVLKSRERYLAALETGLNDFLGAWRYLLDAARPIQKAPADGPLELDAVWVMSEAATAARTSLRAHRIYLAPLIPIGGSSQFLDTALAVEGLAGVIKRARTAEQRVTAEQDLRQVVNVVPELYDRLVHLTNEAIRDLKTGRLF